MKIQTINDRNSKKLAVACMDLLLNNSVKAQKYGITNANEDGKMKFFFETGNKAFVVEFDAQSIIGGEPEEIAKELLNPNFIAHVKENL